MKVCVSFATGCPRAEFDAFSVLEYLKANDCVITEEFIEADLILISGCAVSKRNEDRTKSLWSIALKKKKPNAKIIYFGCFPGIISDSPLYDCNGITIKKRQFSILDDIIEAKVRYNELNNIGLSFEDNIVRNSFSFYEKLRARFESGHDLFWNVVRLIIEINKSRRSEHFSCIEERSIFNLRISIGCNGSCTYCAIRAAVGPLNSNDLNNISGTLRRAVSSGHSKIRLIADDVGSYGQDCGKNIVDLFNEIYTIPGNFQILVDDFNPRWLIAYFSELLEIISQNPTRLAYISFPIQSGSNKILKLMQRGYDAHEAKQCLCILRGRFPKLKLNTHILIGFPGESIDDFNDTLNFISSDIFDEISIYKYSDRPRIVSSCFHDKVNKYDKTKRSIKLIKTVGLRRVAFIC